MPVYAIEVAVICDDIETDGILALAVITDALGIEPDHDTVTLEHGTDESGHPVLLATLSVPNQEEEEPDVGSIG